MNNWQNIYFSKFCSHGYSGIHIRRLKLLGNVHNSVTVHFPEFKSRFTSLCQPAEVVTYVVTEATDDMPNGLISVATLAANLALWTDRGYEIEY